MRAVVQRVREASVRVGGEFVASCGPGLVVLLGVANGDTEARADRMAARIARLRVFEADNGRFDRSLLDEGGEVLVVSQFTVLGDTSRGHRPSFSSAAPPEVAEPLYVRVCEMLEAEGVVVGRGVFGARMLVALVNDGPVTIVLDL